MGVFGENEGKTPAPNIEAGRRAPDLGRDGEAGKNPRDVAKRNWDFYEKNGFRANLPRLTAENLPREVQQKFWKKYLPKREPYIGANDQIYSIQKGIEKILKDPKQAKSFLEWVEESLGGKITPTRPQEATRQPSPPPSSGGFLDTFANLFGGKKATEAKGEETPLPQSQGGAIPQEWERKFPIISQIKSILKETPAGSDPNKVKEMLFLYYIESTFRPNVSAGSSQGLGQVQGKARQEAEGLLSPEQRKRLGSSFDIRTSIYLSERYWNSQKSNVTEYLQKNGIQRSPTWLECYLFYNQGQSGGSTILTKLRKLSGKKYGEDINFSKEILKNGSAISVKGNNPWNTIIGTFTGASGGDFPTSP